MKKTTLATLIVLSAAGAYTSQDSFQNIQVDGTNISIPQGSYQTAAGVVRIAKDQTVQVTAVTSLRVEDEEMVLPKTPLNPGTWKGNGKLSKLRVANITACGSVDPESITVVRKNRSPLKEGEDYLAEKRWGRIVKGPSGAVADNEPVFVSYTCRLQRLDTVAADKAGKVLYLEGKESMIAPPLPALPDGCIVLFNVYRPYDSSVLLQSNIFLNEVDAKTVATGSTPGRTPKTLAKLKAGEPVTIVCWGDSVTVGADLENPQDRYSNQLEQRLKAKFPRADITVTNISIGGTQSAYWLKGWDEKKTEGCTFARVLAAKPDLVTLEFVNDTSIPIARSRELYDRISSTLAGIGAEMILITPHFTNPNLMGTDDFRTTDTRPYVAFLKEYSEAKHVALANASARWENLYRSGLPYPTLLANGWNHPDQRGHAIFADELMKCFE